MQYTHRMGCQTASKLNVQLDVIRVNESDKYNDKQEKEII